MKNLLRRFLPPIIALIAGIVFIVVGCINLSHVNNYPEIKAVVTSVEKTITTDGDGNTTEDVTVRVKYTVDNTEYNELLQSASGDFEEGETITVRYNPEKPDYVTGATKGSSIIGIVVGIVLTLGGIIATVLAFIRGR